MENNQKMWYSIVEAAEYLNMEEKLLEKKVDRLNMEMRELPGQRGWFLSWKYVMRIEWMIKPTNGNAQ